MKKSLFLLVILVMSLPAMAGLKEKHVIGTWTYRADAGTEILTGTITFSNEEGVLTGEVNTDMGEYINMTKVEIRDNNILYFEVPTDYEVLKVTVTMNKKNYSGTIASQQGDMPISGEKK